MGSDTESSDPDLDGRYYCEVNPLTGHISGKYKGDTAKQVADVIFGRMLEGVDIKDRPAELTVCVSELSNNNNVPTKVYSYKYERTKLSEPRQINIVNRKTGCTETLTYCYKTKVRRIRAPDVPGFVNDNWSPNIWYN
jgi:hypothetical protein